MAVAIELRDLSISGHEKYERPFTRAVQIGFSNHQFRVEVENIYFIKAGKMKESERGDCENLARRLNAYHQAVVRKGLLGSETIEPLRLLSIAFQTFRREHKDITIENFNRLHV